MEITANIIFRNVIFILAKETEWGNWSPCMEINSSRTTNVTYSQWRTLELCESTKNANNNSLCDLQPYEVQACTCPGLFINSFLEYLALSHISRRNLLFVTYLVRQLLADGSLTEGVILLRVVAMDINEKFNQV